MICCCTLIIKGTYQWISLVYYFMGHGIKNAWFGNELKFATFTTYIETALLWLKTDQCISTFNGEIKNF